MADFRFIGPLAEGRDAHANEDAVHLQSRLQPYVKNTLLAKHLDYAARIVGVEYGAAHRVNTHTGDVFKCISYYPEQHDANAYCSKQDDTYLVTVEMPFVRRLVKLCHLLRPSLELRPRAGPAKETKQDAVGHSEEVHCLLNGDLSVSEAECNDILSEWPPPEAASQIELGVTTLFCDLIRIVWTHEWTHAIGGHYTFSVRDLSLKPFHESSKDRSQLSQRVQTYTSCEILQAIERHADTHGALNCVRAIVDGYDPGGMLVKDRVDVIDRFLFYNIACAVFTVIWSLEERRYSPKDTFFPPLGTPSPDGRSYPFAMTESTHPPAALRYMTLRNVQRHGTNSIAAKTGYAGLVDIIDAYSITMLKTLAQCSNYFSDLWHVMPTQWGARTPIERTLASYYVHLDEVINAIAPRLARLEYVSPVR